MNQIEMDSTTIRRDRLAQTLTTVIDELMNEADNSVKHADFLCHQAERLRTVLREVKAPL